jgi:hypothetical protein
LVISNCLPEASAMLKELRPRASSFDVLPAALLNPPIVRLLAFVIDRLPLVSVVVKAEVLVPNVRLASDWELPPRSSVDAPFRTSDDVLASDAPLLRASVPAVSVVFPVYVFAPPSVSLPAPALVRPAVPLRGMLMVASAVVVMVGVVPARASEPPEPPFST